MSKLSIFQQMLNALLPAPVCACTGMVDAPSSKWGVHHWHSKRVTTPLVKQFAIEAMAIEVVDLSNNSMMMFQLVFLYVYQAGYIFMCNITHESL